VADPKETGPGISLSSQLKGVFKKSEGLDKRRGKLWGMGKKKWVERECDKGGGRERKYG